MNTRVPLTVLARSDRRTTADVEVVIPVFNEETVLEASVVRLHDYLRARFPLTWVLTIVDNASMDSTWGVACRLANEYVGVQAIRLNEKGRGRALRAAWLASDAPVVAYMDVDLSTDLDALLPLVAPLLSGHSDIAIGSRLAPGARVVRGPKREVISRTYNLLLKATLRNGFSDAQCGFKAVRGDVARGLVPLVEDNGWFFDTELLVLAEHYGLRIHEVPVDWVDDPDSRVDVVSTAMADLKGIWRLMGRLATGKGGLPATATSAFGPAIGAGDRQQLSTQLVRFAGIGVVSTLVFAGLFAVLAESLGAIAADVVALALCAIVNLAANRRITFATRGRAGRTRHYASGLALAGLPLVLTVTALAGLQAAAITALPVELLVLTAANGVAALGRFLLLRHWVFR
jgi:putative flippase GtrA